MKILVYGLNYQPELIGAGKYTGEMCRHLRQVGHDVKVVTAPPYYPAWRVSKPYSSHFYRTEMLDGVSIIRCPLYVPKSQRGLKRILHHLSFALTSAPAVIAAALRFKPDIVLTVAPSIMTAPAAVVAGRLSGAMKWLHVQDFEIDAAFDLGFVSGTGFKRAALSAERFILQRFDVASTISPKMIELLQSKGVEPARCIEMREGVDTNAIRPIDKTKSTIRKQFGIPDGAKIALYAGGMGSKQGLEYLVEAARALAGPRPDIMFVLCGAGSMKEQLQAWTKDLPNVKLLGVQPDDIYGELLAAADIHLLPQKPEVNDLVLPAKVAYMEASGNPVIAMAKQNTQLYAELESVGILIEPGDIVALTEALMRLADDPDLRARLGRKGRDRALEHWDSATTLSRIEARMLECCSLRKPQLPAEENSVNYREPFTETAAQDR